MAFSLSDIVEEARLSARALLDYGASLFNPTVRLGVTGLSRAGKTVFITALVHNLIHGGRLPVFEAHASGRIARARLEPQPDDAVPRFDYEAHVARADRGAALAGIDRPHQRASPRHRVSVGAARRVGSGTLTLDIVDYPGEWLLDLPLLGKSYARMVAPRRSSCRAPVRARRWRRRGIAHLATLDPRRAARTSRPRAAGRAAVHRLSQRLPRRALRACACCRPAAS